jgi:uncharacterized SAM-binding protein YcdF (DUF218 family)
MYELVTTLLQPFTVVYLLVGAATVNFWRKPRQKRGRLLLLTVAFIGLTLSCSPAVAYLAVGSLEWQYPPADELPAEAQAIVVLSAGMRPADGPRVRPELDEDSLQRCLHAAHLYRQRPGCTVVVSGGNAEANDSGPSCARVMRDFLVQLGVKAGDIVMEEASTTTYENAVECAKLLKQRRIDNAVLVTDAVDMYRALRCFRKQGLELTPAPCHYRATDLDTSFYVLLPSPGATLRCHRAWHEWLGTAWYWLHGRV